MQLWEFAANFAKNQKQRPLECVSLHYFPAISTEHKMKSVCFLFPDSSLLSLPYLAHSFCGIGLSISANLWCGMYIMRNSTVKLSLSNLFHLNIFPELAETRAVPSARRHGLCQWNDRWPSRCVQSYHP